MGLSSKVELQFCPPDETFVLLFNRDFVSNSLALKYVDIEC